MNKDDDKAFIFTLKNPHRVEPTRFMKRKESDCAIRCMPRKGPLFGRDLDIDLQEMKINIFTQNGEAVSYECHPQYKESLFMKTNAFNNDASLLDYEVYYDTQLYIDTLTKPCKHPDIISEYFETKDISEESLKQLDDDTELLADLDAIHCEDSAIRVKISKYFSKNPSEFLPKTTIVDKQYDDELREWLGSDSSWKLIYRASEHEYTIKSFHECCDNQGPTLVIIKSSEGWVFGGYTTQSWGGERIL